RRNAATDQHGETQIKSEAGVRKQEKKNQSRDRNATATFVLFLSTHQVHLHRSSSWFLSVSIRVYPWPISLRQRQPQQARDLPPQGLAFRRRLVRAVPCLEIAEPHRVALPAPFAGDVVAIVVVEARVVPVVRVVEHGPARRLLIGLRKRDLDAAEVGDLRELRA